MPARIDNTSKKASNLHCTNTASFPTLSAHPGSIQANFGNADFSRN
jgi:hypothetical protein